MCRIHFALVAGQAGSTFRMPTLVMSTGVSGALHIGLLSAIAFVCAIVVVNVPGHIVVAASFATSTVVSLVFLLHATGGVRTCAPVFWCVPTACFSGGAAAAIVIISSLGNFAGFASSHMIGYLKDLTQSTRCAQSGMYVLAGILIIGALAVWFAPARLVNR